MLEEIFEKQRRLQERLGSDIYSQDYRSIMTLAAIDELMEAIRETPWKPWKKQQKYDKEKFKEELIDAWHFLINLSISSGMNSTEVFQRFVNKNNENHTRQDNGY